VDDLTLSNFQEVLSSSIAAANPNRTFTFSPTNSGPFVLEVRPLLFGDFPSEWGPSLALSAVANVQVSSIQRGTGSTWNINFNITGSASGFELWSSTTVDGTFSREASATIQTIVAGSQYRAVVNSSTTQKFFRIRVL
jgi:hypothetical protein